MSVKNNRTSWLKFNRLFYERRGVKRQPKFNSQLISWVYTTIRDTRGKKYPWLARLFYPSKTTFC